MADSSDEDPITKLESENAALRRELTITQHMLGQYQQGVAEHQAQLARMRAEQATITQPTA